MSFSGLRLTTMVLETNRPVGPFGMATARAFATSRMLGNVASSQGDTDGAWRPRSGSCVNVGMAPAVAITPSRVLGAVASSRGKSGARISELVLPRAPGVLVSKVANMAAASESLMPNGRDWPGTWAACGKGKAGTCVDVRMAAATWGLAKFSIDCRPRAVACWNSAG